MDWYTDCGMIHILWIHIQSLWINPHLVDGSTACSMINRLCIHPNIMDWSMDFVLIRRLRNDPYIVNWSADSGLIHRFWIEPHIVDWSTESEWINKIWIDPRFGNSIGMNSINFMNELGTDMRIVFLGSSGNLWFYFGSSLWQAQIRGLIWLLTRCFSHGQAQIRGVNLTLDSLFLNLFNVVPQAFLPYLRILSCLAWLGTKKKYYQTNSVIKNHAFFHPFW